MKKTLTIILFVISVSTFSQNDNYKTFSYSEFFQLIENEKDSVFKLSNAIILFNSKTDQRFTKKNSFKRDPNFKYKNDIIVNKHLELDNVEFISGFNSKNEIEGAFIDIVFNKKVYIRNSSTLNISYCKFKDSFRYSLVNCKDKILKLPNFYYQMENIILIEYSSFGEVEIVKTCLDGERKIITYLNGNEFSSNDIKERFLISLRENNDFFFEDNKLDFKDVIYINNDKNYGKFSLNNNKFTAPFIYLGNLNINGKVEWKNNHFSSKVLLEIDGYNNQDEIDWENFSNKFISYPSFTNYTLKKEKKFPLQLRPEEKDIYLKTYIDSVRYFDKDYSNEEIALKGIFYNHYKNKFNFDAANEAYIELKDFETKRLAIRYQQNPTFKTYFKWKVNQFLKLFSDYGTEPSKAIIFSLYVIVLFALVYLLFPNSWDTLGNKRLMYRFEFFAKYLSRNEGMHTLYLEEKQKEISTYEDFKNNLEKAQLELPSFFINWSKPLYNASLFSTKMMSRFLKLTDVLQGKWKDLTPKQKRWKNIQIGFLLIVGLFYDVFIKVLNALMLSINTFTTLGFGEIPIKGLPRYLAIIQGFIGWFMLTIFSVSLISQLLN